MRWRLGIDLGGTKTEIAALDPAGALSGHPGNDVWNHVWGYWWVADELRRGYLPLRTDLQHFPGSSLLFFIDTFGALVSLPLQWLAGPVLALNAVVLGCFWAAGLAAWALARQCTWLPCLST